MIVVWRVVDSCNLSCPFCAFDKRLTFPRTRVDPRDVLRFAKVLADHHNQLGGRDRPEFYPAHRLTCADVDELEVRLPDIRRSLQDRGVILIGQEDYLRRIRASALNETIPIEDCGPGESFLFIDESGQISPCSFTTRDYGVDVRTVTSATDLADLPDRFRELKTAKRSTQCDDCLSTQVCGKYKSTSNDPGGSLALSSP